MGLDMNSDDNEILLGVLSEVFEGFAFMFVEEEPDFESEAVDECLRTKIDFSGKGVKGFLEIIASVDFCNDLAENILGIESDELPQDAGESALKEVVNVSCGYLLAEKFGTEEVFDLSIPQIEIFPENQCKGLFTAEAHMIFLVDETPILVRFVYGE